MQLPVPFKRRGPSPEAVEARREAEVQAEQHARTAAASVSVAAALREQRRKNNFSDLFSRALGVSSK